jgi:hypothetical protein
MSFKPRYILAEEAEERIVALYRKEKGDAAEIFNTAVDACQNIILDMYDNSSENVVPVVRCKDCKHNSLNRVSGNALCDLGMNLFHPYDFCSQAERKE